MKPLLLTVAFLSAFLFSSCSAEDEPNNYNSYWTYIDENEQEGLNAIYKALGLDDDRSYDYWAKNLASRFFRSPYVSSDLSKFRGLAFGYDSTSNRLVVKGMSLYVSYAPNGFSLPDIFDKFKHLEYFKLEFSGGALKEIPSTLCDLPLKELRIRPFGTETPGIKGTFPKNFGKLAETLEFLDIHNTQYGNKFLNLILEKFKNLKECYIYSNNFTGEVPKNLDKFSDKLEICDLEYNHFTGKVPYMENWQTVYYCFDNNEFTEFDWRYIDNFEDFKRFCSEGIYPPRFRGNNISGKLPDYFNQDFFDYYRENYWDVDSYLGSFLGGNPIYYDEYNRVSRKGFWGIDITPQ